MPELLSDLAAHEEALLSRALRDARQAGFSGSLPTIEKVCRFAVEGLSRSIAEAWQASRAPAPAGPARTPAAAFAAREAPLHQARGLSLPAFFGLLKHLRHAYLDLARQADPGGPAATFLEGFFDRLETAVCAEWSGLPAADPGVAFEEAMARLTQEKDRYLTIFESFPGPVLFAGAEGRVASMNAAAAELFGRTAQAARARPGRETSLSQLPWLDDAVTRLLATAEADLEEEVEADSTRGRRRFGIRLRRLLDGSQKLAGILVFLDDLTERREIERRLLLAERLAEHVQVATELAHEVNNPLACIQASLEVLDADLGTAIATWPSLDLGDCHDAIAGGRDGVQRIARVIRGIEAALAAREGKLGHG